MIHAGLPLPAIGPDSRGEIAVVCTYIRVHPYKGVEPLAAVVEIGMGMVASRVEAVAESLS